MWWVEGLVGWLMGLPARTCQCLARRDFEVVETRHKSMAGRRGAVDFISERVANEDTREASLWCPVRGSPSLSCPAKSVGKLDLVVVRVQEAPSRGLLVRTDSDRKHIAIYCDAFRRRTVTDLGSGCEVERRWRRRSTTRTREQQRCVHSVRSLM